MRHTDTTLTETPNGTPTAPGDTEIARLKMSNARLMEEIETLRRTRIDLEESRDRYRFFAMAATEGIFVHDNGIAIEMNDAFVDMVGYPRETLIGANMIEMLVMPEDRQRVRRNMISPGCQVYEIKVRSASDKTYPVELRSKPVEMAGRACRVVSVRDISHRKKTERQLIQSQKMEAVGTLAGGIAHDFNNMLAGIQGNVEILRHQLSPNSPHQRRLSIISQIVQRGTKLSGQLLGYARGGQTEIRAIDLNRLVEESLDMFGHAHRHITVTIGLNSSTPRVTGDRTQIEQVLLNLMINAVHAMSSGGELRIETGGVDLDENTERTYEVVPGHYAMLRVQDTGHGMDPETLKQIFEPFFTTKAEGEGTGLGLASTYGIIKNHNGYIDVFSTPGKGTRFDVFLPATRPGDRIEPTPAPDPQNTAETILLVDDEPDFLDVGREILMLLGYQVIATLSRDQAVSRLQEASGTIQLVLMDMIMPGTSAEKAIRQMRDIDPTIPVLLASGYSQDDKAGRELMRLCQGFIQKPFRLTELSRTIRDILREACCE
jgi:two-component system, cell cycle sensor histidine kinase and response regulator CckA